MSDNNVTEYNDATLRDRLSERETEREKRIRENCI